MLQYLVCVDSHVSGDSHFSIFYNWQGLMVIPFVSTLYPIFPTHLPVYPQGHLVVALPILILAKLLASTGNVPHCFSELFTVFIVSRIIFQFSWTRKILAMNGCPHTRSNVAQLYLLRKKGGGGLIGIEECVRKERKSLPKGEHRVDASSSAERQGGF